MTPFTRRELVRIEAECRRRLRLPPPWPHGTPSLKKVEHKPAHVRLMHEAIRARDKAERALGLVM